MQKMTKDPIKWTLETLPIQYLKAYEKNARILTEKQAKHLKDCIEDFGLIDKPIVNADYEIIGGHQRIEILRQKGVAEIECWLPDRMLDHKEVEKLNISLNRNGGDWDYDLLANCYDVGDLLDWGFDEDELGLGKTEKPKKEPKPQIVLEFSDKETMIEYVQQCETIAVESAAKMKIKG